MSETATTPAADTVTFPFFDRDWTVPTKRRLSHLVKMRDGMNQRFGDPDVVSAEAMLGDEQFAELLKIDPTEEDLSAFVGKMAEALGLGSTGNS